MSDEDIAYGHRAAGIMEKLIASAQVKVRFDEVDSMNIVWHGNYSKYFEDARVAFGEKYHLGYLDIFGEGYYAPLVSLDFKFINPMIFGDSCIAEAEYVPCEGAKIQFIYRLVKADGTLIAKGSSTQVFLDLKYKLALYAPEFYDRWRIENGVKI